MDPIVHLTRGKRSVQFEFTRAAAVLVLAIVLLPMVAFGRSDLMSWRDFRLEMSREQFAKVLVALTEDHDVNRMQRRYGEPNFGVPVLSPATKEERFLDPAVPVTIASVTNGRVFRFVSGYFLAGKLNRLEVCTSWMTFDQVVAKARERYGADDKPFTFVSTREMVPEVWEGPPGGQHRAKESTQYSGRIWLAEETFFLAYRNGDDTCLVLQNFVRPGTLAQGEKRASDKAKDEHRKKVEKEVNGISF